MEEQTMGNPKVVEKCCRCDLSPPMSADLYQMPCCSNAACETCILKLKTFTVIDNETNTPASRSVCPNRSCRKITNSSILLKMLNKKTHQETKNDKKNSDQKPKRDAANDILLKVQQQHTTNQSSAEIFSRNECRKPTVSHLPHEGIKNRCNSCGACCHESYTLEACRHTLCQKCLAECLNRATFELPTCLMYRCCTQILRNDLIGIFCKIPSLSDVCERLLPFYSEISSEAYAYQCAQSDLPYPELDFPARRPLETFDETQITRCTNDQEQASQTETDPVLCPLCRISWYMRSNLLQINPCGHRFCRPCAYNEYKKMHHRILIDDYEKAQVGLMSVLSVKDRLCCLDTGCDAAIDCAPIFQLLAFTEAESKLFLKMESATREIAQKIHDDLPNASEKQILVRFLFEQPNEEPLGKYLMCCPTDTINLVALKFFKLNNIPVETVNALIFTVIPMKLSSDIDQKQTERWSERKNESIETLGIKSGDMVRFSLLE